MTFTTTGGGNWKVWDRFISIDSEQVVHVGNICGTCEFFFNRVSGRAVPSAELASIRTQLETGLSSVDSTALAFRELVPNGTYHAALFELTPEKAGTQSCPDYFSCEQRQAWTNWDQNDSATAVPHYYRAGTRKLEPSERLFEFIVPLSAEEDLNFARVQQYVDRMRQGQRPTAVAVGILDVKTSMSFPEDDTGNEIEPEETTHWCFANYLLDGHHKVQAAHLSGRPITLLSLITDAHSIGSVDSLVEIYRNAAVIGAKQDGA